MGTDTLILRVLNTLETSTVLFRLDLVLELRRDPASQPVCGPKDPRRPHDPAVGRESTVSLGSCLGLVPGADPTVTPTDYELQDRCGCLEAESGTLVDAPGAAHPDVVIAEFGIRGDS